MTPAPSLWCQRLGAQAAPRFWVARGRALRRSENRPLTRDASEQKRDLGKAGEGRGVEAATSETRFALRMTPAAS